MKTIYINFLFLVCLFSKAQNGYQAVYNTSSTNITRMTNPAFDSNGHAWVGCSPSANDVLKYDGISWTIYSSPFAALNAGVSVIEVDASNNVWLGTNQGLAMFNGTSWTSYTTSNSGLINNNIVSIAFDGSDTWVGTTGGLSKFDGTNWTSYTKTTSSLPSDSVWGILVDGAGNLWLAQKNYLTNFNNGTFNNFYRPANTFRGVVKIAADYYVSATDGVLKFNGSTFSEMTSDYFTDFPATITGLPPRITIIHNLPSVCFIPNKGVYTFNESQNIINAWYFNNIVTSGSINEIHFARQHPINNKIYITFRTSPANKPGFLILDTASYNGLGLGSNAANERNIRNLDVNQVNAMISNRGDRFWDFLGNPGYEIPKGSKTHASHAGALWIGGKDNGGNLHMAAQTYRWGNSDFWPGPLDTVNTTSDSTVSWNYDRLWKIDQLMLNDFQQNFANGNVANGSYQVPEDILTWPAHGSVAQLQAKYLAPFVDVNGDGVYNPVSDGDYPKIKGDQSVYCIFNDKLAPHSETGAPGFGLEVHYEAYAFNCNQLADSLQILNYTTFHDYTIINRSSYSYDSVYTAIWNDTDVGNYSDDIISCNPSENFGMTCNGDNNDEDAGGLYGYHDDGPILSSVILRGPQAYPNDGVDNNNNGVIDEPNEECLLTNFMTYKTYYGANPDPTKPPTSADEYYDYCRSIWRDSTHLTQCGYQSGAISNYYMPFLPYDSSVCSPQVPRDTRMISAAGPFNLQPGQRFSFTEAITFTQDTSLQYSPYDSTFFVKNMENINRIKQWYYSNTFPSCYLWSGLNDYLKENISFELFPNPAVDIVSIRSISAIKQIDVYDVSGKHCLRNEFNMKDSQINFSVNALSNGIYFVRCYTENGSAVKKVSDQPIILFFRTLERGCLKRQPLFFKNERVVSEANEEIIKLVTGSNIKEEQCLDGG